MLILLMNRRGISRSRIVSVLCGSGVEELKPFMMLDIPLGVSVCSSMKSLGCIGFTGSDRGMIVGVSRVKCYGRLVESIEGVYGRCSLIRHLMILANDRQATSGFDAHTLLE